MVIESNIKLEKIVSKKDVFTKCDHCKKELKHAYYTNIGILGQNCFLTSIGLPKHTKKSSPILPNIVYEQLAESIINQLKTMDNEVFVQYFKQFYQNDFAGVFKSGLVHFRVYLTNRSIKEYKLTITCQSILSKLCSIPFDMMDKIYETEIWYQFYVENIQPTEQFIQINKVF